MPAADRLGADPSLDLVDHETARLATSNPSANRAVADTSPEPCDVRRSSVRDDVQDDEFPMVVELQIVEAVLPEQAGAGSQGVDPSGALFDVAS